MNNVVKLFLIAHAVSILFSACIVLFVVFSEGEIGVLKAKIALKEMFK